MASAALKKAWKALAAVEDFELGENIFGGDWIGVTISKPADTALALDLAKLAAAAHRPADGSPCKPPPMGADLARRKRFH